MLTENNVNDGKDNISGVSRYFPLVGRGELMWAICMSNEQHVIHSMFVGARPSLTKLQPPSGDWCDILRMCWSENARCRPTATQCHEFFTHNKT